MANLYENFKQKRENKRIMKENINAIKKGMERLKEESDKIVESSPKVAPKKVAGDANVFKSHMVATDNALAERFANRLFSNGLFEEFLQSTLCVSKDKRNADLHVNTVSYFNAKGVDTLMITIHDRRNNESYDCEINKSNIAFMNKKDEYTEEDLRVLGAYILFLENTGCLNTLNVKNLSDKYPAFSKDVWKDIKALDKGWSDKISFAFCGMDYELEKTDSGYHLSGKIYGGPQKVSATFDSPYDCARHLGSKDNYNEILNTFKESYYNYIVENFDNILENYINYNSGIQSEVKRIENNRLSIYINEECRVILDETNGIILNDVPVDTARHVFNNYLLARKAVYGKNGVPSSKDVRKHINEIFNDEPADFYYFGNVYRIIKEDEDSYKVEKHNLYLPSDADTILGENLTKEEIKSFDFANLIATRTKAFFEYADEFARPLELSIGGDMCTYDQMCELYNESEDKKVKEIWEMTNPELGGDDAR